MRATAILALLSVPATAQTADEIVALAIAARGGAAKIRAIETQRLAGQITVGADVASLLVEIRRPASIREEVVSGTTKVVRVSDGQAGWVRVDREVPRALETPDVRTLAASADLDGPLLDYKSKENRIELNGEVQMEGRRHFKLVIRKQDGTVRTDYVDASTFLETKWEWQFSNGGKRYTAESWFRDYRTVDGIACAFTVESNTLGTSIRQKIVFSKIEINPAILPGRFGKPE